MTCRRRAGDQGSALVLALILVSAIGLMLTVVIQFAGTGMRATTTYNDSREESYGVDGAVEAAIQDVRNKASAGVFKPDVDTCPDYQPPSGVDGMGLLVECEALSGSGGTFEDQPPFALLMTGTANGEGINSTASGGSVLTIDGGIYTRGSVTAPDNESNDALTVYGDITSFGPCTPAEKITSIGGNADCGRGSAADDGRWDLGYKAAAASAPTTVDPTPVCGANAVEWKPGTYTEVPTQPSGCAQKVWVFEPGVYYFDFPSPKPDQDWNRDDWNLDTSKATVIGGTIAKLSSPGGCEVDTKEKKHPGVQFIFGGTSRIVNNSQGSLELCASSTEGNKQKIAVYGLTSGSRVPSGEKKLTDDLVSVPSDGHTPEPALRAIDDGSAGVATYTKDAVTVLQYDFPDIPAGAVVTSAKLRVRHGETADRPDDQSEPVVAAQNQLKVELSAPGLNSVTLDNCGPSLCTAPEIDLLPALGTRYQYRTLNDVVVSVKVTAKPKKPDPLPLISSIDGLELDVEYIPVGFRAVCATCELLESTVNQNLRFHGTVYAPGSGFDLTVHNDDTTVFERGLIGRTLDVNVSNSSKQADSPFRLPAANAAPRRVLFNGYEVAADGTKTLRLRAVAKYTDSKRVDGQDLAFPGYRLDIESWSVVRPD